MINLWNYHVQISQLSVLAFHSLSARFIFLALAFLSCPRVSFFAGFLESWPAIRTILLLEGCDASILLDYRAVTTPFGIALGIGISSAYDENSPTALIVEGVFNAASSGILIYMALVDLLAADFINSSRMRKNGTLQLCSYVALLLGIGAMSLIAKWA
jgi:hypothetical protein